MKTRTFPAHTGLSIYGRKYTNVYEMAMPKFKNHHSLYELHCLYRLERACINVRNYSIKNITKLADHWLHGTDLIYVESENILVSKGIIFDAQTLNILMVILVDNKYVTSGRKTSDSLLFYTNHGYLNRCLEIYVNQSFVGTKAFNKLLPLLEDIKLIVLSTTEFEKLYG